MPAWNSKLDRIIWSAAYRVSTASPPPSPLFERIGRTSMIILRLLLILSDERVSHLSALLSPRISRNLREIRWIWSIWFAERCADKGEKWLYIVDFFNCLNFSIDLIDCLTNILIIYKSSPLAFVCAVVLQPSSNDTAQVSPICFALCWTFFGSEWKKRRKYRERLHGLSRERSIPWIRSSVNSEGSRIYILVFTRIRARPSI